MQNRSFYHRPQQSSRRNPAKRFRWEEDERQRERVLPLAAGRGIRRPLGRRPASHLSGLRRSRCPVKRTGRDIPYRELALEFDGEDHVWKLLSDDCEQTEQPNERILFLLSELLRRQPEISAPAKALLEKIDPAGTEGLTPNSFSHRIRKSVDALRRNGITVSFRKSNGDRLICLKRVDGVDDPAAENIVTIDPENPPCFGV